MKCPCPNYTADDHTNVARKNFIDQRDSAYLIRIPCHPNKAISIGLTVFLIKYLEKEVIFKQINQYVRGEVTKFSML